MNEGSATAQWTVDPADTALSDDSGVVTPLFRIIDNVTFDILPMMSQVMVVTPVGADLDIKIDMLTPSNFVAWLQGCRVYIRRIA